MKQTENYIIDDYIYDFSNFAFVSDADLTICEDFGIDPCMLGLTTLTILKGENTNGPGTTAANTHNSC